MGFCWKWVRTNVMAWYVFTSEIVCVVCVKPCKHTTFFRRLNNVHNVETTSYGKKPSRFNVVTTLFMYIRRCVLTGVESVGRNNWPYTHRTPLSKRSLVFHCKPMKLCPNFQSFLTFRLLERTVLFTKQHGSWSFYGTSVSGP